MDALGIVGISAFLLTIAWIGLRFPRISSKVGTVLLVVLLGTIAIVDAAAIAWAIFD